MSFFGNMFGKSEEENRNSYWTEIKNEEDLERAIDGSFVRTAVIFKHSTRCIISKTVLRNFERQMNDKVDSVDFYFLDLLAHRDISNKIAEVFDVTHQSPQMIVLKDGKAVESASHDSISMNLV